MQRVRCTQFKLHGGSVDGTCRRAHCWLSWRRQQRIDGSLTIVSVTRGGSQSSMTGTWLLIAAIFVGTILAVWGYRSYSVPWATATVVGPIELGPGLGLEHLSALPSKLSRSGKKYLALSREVRNTFGDVSSSSLGRFVRLACYWSLTLH